MNREELILEMQLYLAEFGAKKLLEAVAESVQKHGELVGGIYQLDSDETAEHILEEANRY